MLEETIKECWGEEEIEMLKEGLEKLSADRTPFYEQCAAWVKQSEKERQVRKEASKGGNVSRIAQSMPFGASDFGHHFKMHHLLTEKPAEEIVCGICGNLVGEGTRTDVCPFYTMFVCIFETCANNVSSVDTYFAKDASRAACIETQLLMTSTISFVPIAIRCSLTLRHIIECSSMLEVRLSLSTLTICRLALNCKKG